MNKKELELLSAFQRNLYTMSDTFKSEGNDELYNEYITERVAVKRFMRIIGYEWDYHTGSFVKDEE